MATPPRCKNVCWTLFDATPEQTALIQTCVDLGHASYVVFGHEVCPKTGKKHLQGYTEFVKPMSWPAINKLWNMSKGQHVHCSRRRGTPLEASVYCKKDGDFQEFGVITPPGEGQGKRSDLIDTLADIDAGKTMKEIAMAHGGTFVRYSRGLIAYKQHTVPHRTETTICIVLFGASNAGKTRWVENNFPGACWISKGNNGTWFDTYEQQLAVVFDEFHGGFFPFSLWKRLIDSTPLSLDTKGGGKVFNSRFAIFMSNDAPETWYHDLTNANIKAFNRRLHFVFEAQEQVQLGANGSVPTGNFVLRVHKTVLPYKAAVVSEWCLPQLSHDESVQLLNFELDSELRNSISAKTCMKTLAGSEGVIMTPSLEKILSQKLDFYNSLQVVWLQCMGQDAVQVAAAADTPADCLSVANHDRDLPEPLAVEPPHQPSRREETEAEDLSAPSALTLALLKYDAIERPSYYDDLSMPSPTAPAKSPRVVRHDQVLKRTMFQSNYPELTWDDVAVMKADRVPPPDATPRLKRTRRRRNPKCIYLDDEAGEKGASEPDSETE